MKSWSETKAGLLNNPAFELNADGSPNPNKKRVMSQVFDNIKNKVDPSALLQTLAIALAVVPNLIAHELVSVQALTAIFDNEVTLSRMEEITEDRYCVCSPPCEYSGMQKLKIDLLNTLSPVTFPFHFHMYSQPKFRKVRESFPLDARTLNLSSRHMVDFPAFSELIQDLIAEFDQTLITNLRVIAGEPQSCYIHRTWSQATFIDGGDSASLSILINRAANLAAARTGGGTGNRAILSRAAYGMLKHNINNAFITQTDQRDIKSIQYVGTLNNTIKVYIDPHALDDHPVLVLLKGHDEDHALGAYTPYIPATGRVVIDPATFEPVMAYRSIDNFVTHPAKNAGHSEDYIFAINILDETKLC